MLFRRIGICIFVLYVSLVCAEDVDGPLRASSPDGNVAVQFKIKSKEGAGSCLFWNVTYKGETVLEDSQLGFTLQDSEPLESGFKLAAAQVTSQNSTWLPVYGERSSIRDNYRQLQVTVEDGQVPARKMQLTFRAYDEGAAFRVTFPEQEAFNKITINQENTQFRFTDDHLAWAVYSAQGVYARKRLSAIGSNCERPLTVKVRDDLYLSVLEAGLVDYARMKLKEHAALPNTLVSQLAGSATVTAPYEMPWRVLMIAETPGELMENNYLVLNLNEPCKISDTSWIKPGKVMRDVTITKANSKAIVDFAAVSGLDYVHIDAGWYGDENTNYPAVDAMTVKPSRSIDPNFDLNELMEIIDYAHGKGVKVMLYVNRRHLEAQMDEIFPLYRSWGIDGIKYGFVQVGSQRWTDWLHMAIRKAAEYKFVVDVHDEYRPSGYERTYPNLMTAEGIRGNETGPTAELNLVIPFTRMLCGAGDYTICWHEKRLKCSWPHQMAASVVYYSPLQFLFWYDRPSQYTGEEPFLDYFKHLKTVWDETKVLHGEIGEYITVARRDGQDWFVGTMNAVERRQLNIPLDFLTQGQRYTAYIYKDTDPTKSEIKQISYEQIAVTWKSVITADMASNGGHAIRIVKELSKQ